MRSRLGSVVVPALLVASCVTSTEQLAPPPLLELHCLAQGEAAFTFPVAGPDRVAEVTNAGDVDGDGLDDILVLLKHRPPSGDFFDRGLWRMSMSILSGKDLSTLVGDTSATLPDAFAVGTLGDVTHDGREDLAIALRTPGRAARIDVCSVVEGELIRQHWIAGEHISPGDVIDGDVHAFGSVLLNAGDCDGDGVSDIAVGSPEAYLRGMLSRVNGVFEVYSGRTGARVWARADVGAEHGFARSACLVDDLDGDVVRDIAVGSPPSQRALIHNYLQNGVVYILSGATGKGLYVWAGDGQMDAIARKLDVVGDVNGDGVTELAVGLFGMDSYAEAVHVRDVRSGDIMATLEGALFDRWSYAWLGDINGDGLSEVATFQAMGAREWGCDSALEIRSIREGVLAVLSVEQGLDVCGAAVSGLGDVNGDGRPDLVVVDRLVEAGAGATVRVSVFGFVPQD